MGGNAVQQGAVVRCAHGGQAEPTLTNPRVTLGGAPAVSLPPPWTVRTCTPPSGPPCATAAWITGSVRVTSSGSPLVVDSGTATCVPTGVPLRVFDVQSRVHLE